MRPAKAGSEGREKPVRAPAFAEPPGQAAANSGAEECAGISASA